MKRLPQQPRPRPTGQFGLRGLCVAKVVLEELQSTDFEACMPYQLFDLEP